MPKRASLFNSMSVLAPMLLAALSLAATGCGVSHEPIALGWHSAGSATVWAVGDGADGGEAGSALAASIARAEPDRFLYLGDVYETGSAIDFADHYNTTYGRLARETAPTPGNHDWPMHAEGYDDYWSVFLGKSIPEYYSFSLGGWELLSLNSESAHDEGSPQVRWLHSKVSAPGTCRLAFWHRPRYSDGEHGDAPDVEPLWKALEGHAAIVLNGHDHNMQRFEPRDGITEFVAGAGGHGLYEVHRDDRLLAFMNDREYGALRLELERGLAKYAFVSAEGRTLDSGQVSCRPSS